MKNGEIQLTKTSAANWRWVGERGARVATGGATLACFQALRAQNFPELEDIIPADDSLLLVFRRGMQASAALCAWLAAPHLDLSMAATGVLHEIPLVYGGAAGKDLAEVARQAGMRTADYVDRHAAVEYRVAFLGFQPGFPYLRGLPPGLQASRRATPRTRVAAGSVAVGGAYCGIYPASGPGGWQVIGRTEVVLFDPLRTPPALLLPGDRVRFVPA
jgi:KipI family sensor histidine kinase inhibitor